MTYRLLLTCEHASNEIPARFKHYFTGHNKLLTTHQGWDIGARYVFNHLKRSFNCPAYSGKWSRLLIDLNRSRNNKNLLSPLIEIDDVNERAYIINNYYLPYRNAVANEIAINCGTNVMTKRKQSSATKNKGSNSLKAPPLLHISVHSFTPVLNGQRRNCDLGILYDPTSILEKRFAAELRQQIIALNADLSVRMNYPYLGISDGLTSAMRKLFHKNKNYIGIELEMNQKLFTAQGEQKQLNIAALITTALRNLL